MNWSKLAAGTLLTVALLIVFIDKAKEVGATPINCGYTTVGSLLSFKEDDVRGAECIAPVSGTMDSITVYVHDSWTAGEKQKMILYDASGNVIAETEERSDGGSGWQTFDFDSAQSVASGTKYLIGAFQDSAIRYRYNDTSGLTSPVTNETGTYPTVQDPAGTASVYQFSIYGTITPSEEGGGSPAPTEAALIF